MSFIVRSNPFESAHILEPVGKLIIGQNVREFRKAFDAAVDDGAMCVVVNCSQMTFIDSSGIGELIGCNQRAQAVGAKLFLCDLPAKVRDLLRVTQVARLFVIFETESAALAAAPAREAANG